MLIQEFTQRLDEYSYLDPKLINVLEKKGFRWLGEGADQAAYLAPGGQAVLKIFGAGFRRTPKTGGRTRGQEMFETWAKYCQSHPDNPYLPKFLPGEGGEVWRPFDFGGRRYLQIWQEYLPQIDRRLNQSLMILDNVIAYDGISAVSGEQLEDRARKYSYVNILRRHLGPRGFKLMAHTLDELRKLAKANGYRPDLHQDNFRSRADGTPVIMDPWTIG